LFQGGNLDEIGSAAAQLLSQAAKDVLDGKYRRIHDMLLEKASHFVGDVVSLTPNEMQMANETLCFSLARVDPRFQDPCFAAFLYIFKEEFRPRHKKNIGIIYIGDALKATSRDTTETGTETLLKSEEFVQRMYTVGANVVKLLLDYNAQCGRGEDLAINSLRVPLVCGVHPEITAEQAYFAFLCGVHAALSTVEPNFRPVIELIPSEAMEGAFESYRAADFHSEDTPESRRTSATMLERTWACIHKANKLKLVGTGYDSAAIRLRKQHRIGAKHLIGIKYDSVALRKRAQQRMAALPKDIARKQKLTPSVAKAIAAFE